MMLPTPLPDTFDFAALARAMDRIPAPASGGELPAGELDHYFGDYLLEEEIARGGMGIVYRARQISLNRVVAVKVLREGVFAGGTEVERFKLEAAAAARLRHPNIVGIHEIGECQGRSFFSMDYVAGPTLTQLLANGALPSAKAAVVMRKIALAIQHAHAHGVLHRDLKPSNVLLDPEGGPMVTDFGLAKQESADSGLTLSCQVLGTPAYMAPEQAEGRTRDTSVRTDVYGLGALFYHLLGGRPPFMGDSHLTVIKQVSNDEPVSVRVLNPMVPLDLGTICTKAMAKDAARRYATAQAMAEDLQRYLDGRPVLARPVGTLSKIWRWARRHRALAASMALIFLSLCALAAVMFLSNRRLAVQEQRLRQQAYAAEIAQAAHEVADYHPKHARELLARQRPAAGEPDFRGLEWQFLCGAVTGQQRAVIGNEAGAIKTLALSGDGRRAVSATISGHLTLWDIASRKALAAARHGNMLSTVLFSPDEKEILSGGDDGFIRRWDGATLTELPDPWPRPGYILRLAWSADGTRLHCAARDGLTVWSNVKPPGEAPSHAAFDAWFSASFSKDARQLILPSVNGPVSVRDGESGKESASLSLDADQAGSSAFSPQGNLASLGYAGGVVRVWDFAAGKVAAILTAHEGACFAQAFSPDSQWLATGGNDGLLKIWSTQTWTLTAVQPGHLAAVRSIDWLDNNQLITGGFDGMIALWDRVPLSTAGWTPLIAPAGLSLLYHGGSVWCFNPQTGVAVDTATRQSIALVDRMKTAAGTAADIRLQQGGQVLVTLPSGVTELRDWEGEVIPGRSVVPMEMPLGDLRISGDGRHVHAFPGVGKNQRLVVGRLGEPSWDFHAGESEALLVAYQFSPNGGWLPIVSSHGNLSLYSTAQKRIAVTQPSAHTGLALGVSFTPDGKECASCGGDGEVRIWESATLQLRRVLRGAPAFTCLAYSPDGKHLAAGTAEGAVFLWDLQTSRDPTVLRFPGPQYVLDIGWAGDGRALVAASRQGYMRWEAHEGWE